jgi:hypothetical protein
MGGRGRREGVGRSWSKEDRIHLYKQTRATHLLLDFRAEDVGALLNTLCDKRKETMKSQHSLGRTVCSTQAAAMCTWVVTLVATKAPVSISSAILTVFERITIAPRSSTTPLGSSD